MDQIFDFLKDNYSAIIWGLIGFVWIIVRLTPTKKDDRILQFIVTILNFIIPDRKKKSPKSRMRTL